MKGHPDIPIESISMVSQSEVADKVELRSQPDNWLISNSVISYPESEKGKLLLIKTDMPHASVLSLEGLKQTVDVALTDKGPAVLRLTDGKPTSDGRRFLIVKSQNPVRIPGDPRDLMLHVCGYTLN